MQLVRCMEQQFLQLYQVSPSVVADVHQYCYKSTGKGRGGGGWREI